MQFKLEMKISDQVQHLLWSVQSILSTWRALPYEWNCTHPTLIGHCPINTQAEKMGWWEHHEVQ